MPLALLIVDAALGQLGAEPVRAALAGYRWCPNPAKYPLSVPELVIPKQRVVFVRH